MHEIHLCTIERIQIAHELDLPELKSFALRLSGSAGLSGVDVHDWRRLCTCFKSASEDLCSSLALVGRQTPTITLPFLMYVFALRTSLIQKQ